MATAYVDGPSLAGVIDEQGPLPPDAVLALAAGLAEGLQAIHRAGLVHRDLKPSNVLLAADGPRIIDFGVSWAGQDSRLTDAGFVVGSPGFISPEQALDREVGPASDVPSTLPVAMQGRSRSVPVSRTRSCTGWCMSHPTCQASRPGCARWSARAWRRSRASGRPPTSCSASWRSPWRTAR
jgi:serine/threonine protein kinase